MSDSGSSDPDSEPEPEPAEGGLSAYERKRLETIEKNRAVMASLGLLDGGLLGRGPGEDGMGVEMVGSWREAQPRSGHWSLVRTTWMQFSTSQALISRSVDRVRPCMSPDPPNLGVHMVCCPGNSARVDGEFEPEDRQCH